jgi:5S rRNA maturation endonuclease (ribonuclease M5)
MGIANAAIKTNKSREKLSETIFKEIFKSNKKKQDAKINKKILLSGENGTAKTSLSLSLLTRDLKDDEIIIYIDIDNSGKEIIQIFYEEYYQRDQIKIYNPNEFKTNQKGASVKDEEAVVNNVTSAAQTVRMALDQGINIKGVIVDGVSFLLEFAESKMRLERNLDADSGAQLAIWKIRNKFFREFSSAYMDLDVPVVFISHADFIPELAQDDKFASVKQRLIDECSMRITLTRETEGSIDNYVATIQKDRGDIFLVNKRHVFMRVNNVEDTIETQYDELFDLIFPTINKQENNK